MHSTGTGTGTWRLGTGTCTGTWTTGTGTGTVLVCWVLDTRLDCPDTNDTQLAAPLSDIKTSDLIIVLLFQLTDSRNLSKLFFDLQPCHIDCDIDMSQSNDVMVLWTGLGLREHSGLVLSRSCSWSQVTIPKSWPWSQDLSSALGFWSWDKDF